jgi:hypothetical protein
MTTAGQTETPRPIFYAICDDTRVSAHDTSMDSIRLVVQGITDKAEALAQLTQIRTQQPARTIGLLKYFATGRGFSYGFTSEGNEETINVT